MDLWLIGLSVSFRIPKAGERLCIGVCVYLMYVCAQCVSMQTKTEGAGNKRVQIHKIDSQKKERIVIKQKSFLGRVRVFVYQC